MAGTGGEPMPAAEYTYAGVMAWMEGEWRRFHREREEWCNEKAILASSVDNLRRLLRAAQANEAASARRIQALENQLRQDGRCPDVAADAPAKPLPTVTEESASLRALRLPAAAAAPAEAPALGSQPLHLSDTPPEEAADTDSMSALSRGWEVGSAASQMSAIQGQGHVASPVSTASSGSVQTAIAASSAGKGDAERKAGKPSVAVKAASLPPAEAAPPSPQAAALTTTRMPPPTTATTSQSTKSWELRVYIRGHFAAIRCGCWCGEGTLMLTGGDDHVIKLWDARRVLKGKEREEPIVTFRGHTAPVLAVASSGDEVLAAAWDGTIRIWKVPPQNSHGHPTLPSPNDAEYTQGSAVLEHHTDAVWGLSVAPATSGDSLTFASVGADGQMLLWRRGADRVCAPAVRFLPTDAMAPDGAAAKTGGFFPIHCKLSASRFFVTYAFTLHGTYGVAMYSLSGQLLWHRAVSSRPTALSLNARGTMLGLGTLDGRLEVYEPNESHNVAHLFSAAPHTSPITAIDFAQDVVFTSGHDGKVAALAVSTASVVQYLPSPHTPRLGESVHVVLYHTGRGIVVSAGADCSIAWFTTSLPQSK
eukprot:TRINITY_DN27722_c0_g1_i1.p1 TRINITY_DN27722_c0_g1~~TRINITY_DN27722_c0_g1_i1.p1  ORF type:complete len:592 (+),score=148.23 TRINITY_DN27722_c0_g1_i1:43-1818(+)